MTKPSNPSRIDSELEELAGRLRFDREFAAADRPYVELDDEGQVVRRKWGKSSHEVDKDAEAAGQ